MIKLFKIVMVFIIMILTSSYQDCMACTIVVKADKKTILVGNNEDYIEPRTKIWFYPSSSQIYGRVIWGFDRYLYKYQGGMNDQGLFIDINAVAYTGWQDSPDKPNLNSDNIEYFLSNCATVDEVVEIINQYDINLDYEKLVIADAKGNSAIIEWLDNKVNIIYRKGDYQISTNYLSPKEPTEPRYQISEDLLTSQQMPTVDLIRKVLSATSYSEYFNQTLYSTICDLKNKKIYLYNFHYFEEAVTFDLDNQLKHGEVSYSIPSLFKTKTQNEYFFSRLGTKLGAKDLRDIIDENNVDEISQKFYEMKEIKRTFSKYDFPEWMMRSLGLAYQADNKLEKAILVFRLNTELHPESTEAYFYLAEAYIKGENKKLAIENYRKILELNPNDKKTLDILNRLKNEK